MRLYFVRHGESEANVLHMISNRDLPHGLTAQGREQAHTLARKLSGVAFTRIFASPVLRAVQTAEILGSALSVPLEITDALRESDCGVIEGRSDDTARQIWHDLWQVWLEQHDWERRIEGGESYLDIKARFVPFIERLCREYRDPADNLILVGHGGLFTFMLPLVLRAVDLPFAASRGFAHASPVIAEARAGELVCIAWGEEPVPAAFQEGRS